MRKAIKWILSRLLPMEWKGFVFIDAISGYGVNEYRERFTNRIVLAEHCFAQFRVETVKSTEYQQVRRMK